MTKTIATESKPRATSLISVALVEDDNDLREGLATLIDETEDFCCVGKYGECQAALIGLRREPAEVVLMDIQLPGMNGIVGARQVKRILPTTDVIMLTMHKDDALVFEALCAVAAVPTPRAQARSFFFLSSARAILPLMPAWNFSQMRGTARNTVGAISRTFSGTVSGLSTKLSFDPV